MLNKQTAQFSGMLDSRKVYRVPVIIRDRMSLNNLAGRERAFTVLAYGAADAANYIRDTEFLEPCSEVIARGPKGGKVVRTVGWESYVGREVFDAAKARQLPLKYGRIEK